MLKEKYSDLGFGTKTGNQKARLMNQDGSFTVERRGINRFDSFSIVKHGKENQPFWQIQLIHQKNLPQLH